MNAGEPRVRRRGFFLHSTDVTEPEVGEHENPEGFPVRVRTNPSRAPRHFTGGRTGRTLKHHPRSPVTRWPGFSVPAAPRVRRTAVHVSAESPTRCAPKGVSDSGSRMGAADRC